MNLSKPNIWQRAIAYILAASTFIIVSETAMQVLSLIRHRSFTPITDIRIACHSFTFWFLILLGFILVSLGHLTLTLLRTRFASVVKRHAFAYAIGYMIAVSLGITSTIIANETMGQVMLNAWGIFLLSAIILFGIAFIAGLTFGRIYEFGRT